MFGCTICPLSFIVIALIFSELSGGGGGGIRPPVPEVQTEPGLERVKKVQTFLSLQYMFRMKRHPSSVTNTVNPLMGVK